MKKNKKVLFLPTFIDFIKDGLPRENQESWLVIEDEENYIPNKVITREKKKEGKDSFKAKGKKLALHYSSEEVRTAIDEDKKALEDVQKLEHHLKKDIKEANKKLKLYFYIFRNRFDFHFAPSLKWCFKIQKVIIPSGLR